MTRREAKMIAEELFQLIRKDCKVVAQEVAEKENEEYLTLNQAAELLKCSAGTLYRTKDRFGAYIKVGNQLRFPKSQLLLYLHQGKLKAANV